MSWKKYFKTAPNTNGVLSPVNGGSSAAQNHFKFQNYGSLLPEVYMGHPNRLERYNQYEAMDVDSEVNSALDIISEFCTQANEQNNTPFDLFFKEKPTETEVSIIKKQLSAWSTLNELDKRMFKIFRNTLKYGDQVFMRDPETFRLFWVDMTNVVKIIVNESDGKRPEQYILRNINPNFENLTVTQVTADNVWHTMPNTAGYGAAAYNVPNNPYTTNSRFQHGLREVAIESQHVVHLSLTEGLDSNWPFGQSVLENIFKVYKQKELLEDSIVIYRVQRAPERRVFYIDVGSMPSHMAMAFVERVKNEIHQRRIPTQSGGSNFMDSTYNPLSINEDYFFPQTAEGRGSKVETLPGGCLAMDTQVVLLDGRTLSIADLAIEYKQGKENWTYSCDPKTGKIVPGLISWAGVTHESAQVIKLTLDNGKTIVCTPDHKFPVPEKGLVEARELTIGQSLFPINLKNKSISEHKKLDYTQVYQNDSKKWEYVHRMIRDFMGQELETLIFESKFKDKIKDVIHHKDHNRFNNNPSNLVWMNWHDHKAYHSSLGFSKSDQEVGTNAAKKRLEELKANSPEKYKEFCNEISERNQKRWKKLTETEKTQLCNKISVGLSQYFENISEEAYNKLVEKNQQISLLGSAALNEKLKNDEFNLYFSQQIKEGWKKFYATDEYIERNNKISKANKERFEDAAYKERIFSQQRIKFDSKLIGLVQQTVQENQTDSKEGIIKKLNLNREVVDYFSQLNLETKCANWNGIVKDRHLIMIIKQAGYKNWKHFRADVNQYNHKIVQIEILSEPIQVGTLTIDVDEKYHDYHNFALASGVFTQNSNLGEIDDLKFFTNKLFRGLRIPSSYLPTGAEDSAAIHNDGKVATALIQEHRFNQYCKRLQSMISGVLDTEFKAFLKWRGLNLDNTMFELKMNEPQNFAKYRQVELDGAKISSFSQLEAVPYLSKRFLLKRFLGLSEEEMMENTQLWREENLKAADAVESDTNLRNVGISPAGIETDLTGLTPPQAPETPEAGAEAGAGTSPEAAPAATPAGGADLTAGV